MDHDSGVPSWRGGDGDAAGPCAAATGRRSAATPSHTRAPRSRRTPAASRRRSPATSPNIASPPAAVRAVRAGRLRVVRGPRRGQGTAASRPALQARLVEEATTTPRCFTAGAAALARGTAHRARVAI